FFLVASQRTPQSRLRRASFFSENWHPFVCFADISPNRGISFQGRHCSTYFLFLPDKLKVLKPNPIKNAEDA
ncbi:MAG: hypothetical protein IJC13_04570, partial [Clostridia bacterium]|nr:hypothetical protein [Clostridia bacterium]